MDALEVCVEQLSQQDRDLLQMRFESGAMNRTVARTIGCSEMTVSRTLNHRLAGDNERACER